MKLYQVRTRKEFEFDRTVFRSVRAAKERIKKAFLDNGRGRDEVVFLELKEIR